MEIWLGLYSDICIYISEGKFLVKKKKKFWIYLIKKKEIINSIRNWNLLKINFL